MARVMYQCEMCGRMHTEKKFAEDCEKKHQKFTKMEAEFDQTDGNGKYPKSIKLWFGTQCCIYNRK
jgi:hypothetical protein